MGDLLGTTAATIVAITVAMASGGAWQGSSPAGGVIRATAGHDVAPLAVPTGDVTFVAVRSLHQHASPIELKLRQATVANTADWPVSFRATFDAGAVEETCTAVLIGPQVLLTAAHCIPPSGRISYAATPGSAKGAGCARHDAWVRGEDLSADFALCRLNAPFQGPPGFRFETVSLARLTPGSPGSAPTVPMILTGYGCTSDSAKRQRLDGLYRIGLTAAVDSSFSPGRAMGARYYAEGGGEVNDLFTLEQGPNLCPGDSGGPAFSPTPVAGGVQGQYANRTVIGVNSRVFFADDAHSRYGASMVSALGAGAFEPWARHWLGALPACGLNGSLPNCRQ